VGLQFVKIEGRCRLGIVLASISLAIVFQSCTKAEDQQVGNIHRLKVVDETPVSAKQPLSLVLDSSADCDIISSKTSTGLPVRLGQRALAFPVAAGNSRVSMTTPTNLPRERMSLKRNGRNTSNSLRSGLRNIPTLRLLVPAMPTPGFAMPGMLVAQGPRETSAPPRRLCLRNG
jgi:hypothetical protein